jgi:hypothetical protein
MGEHHVTLQRDGGQRRWTCVCGWHSDWSYYTDPQSAGRAVRHASGLDEGATP